jgi:proteasome lid subunit RPN8/RPN11
MPVYLKNNTEQLIREHAGNTYPDECCGFLLGEITDTGEREVTEILPMEKQRRDSSHNRFLISPEDSLRAERHAIKQGSGVVGYYHSHPDHPAKPSQYDVEHTPWPGVSSIIVNSTKAGTGDLTSWVLTEDRSAMDPEEVVVVS